MMRILQFASGDLWAGAEVQLYHLARALHKCEQVDLMVVLLNDGQLEQSLRRLNVNVIVLNERELSVYRIFVSLSEIVKKFKPDIIHTHRDKENILGGLIAFLNRIKSLRTVHGAPEFGKSLLNFRGIVIGFLDGLSARFAQQKIVAVSDELKSKLSGRVDASKIIVINNCVDESYVLQKSLDSCEIDLDKRRFNIAFIGRLVPVKRVDLFLKIAKHVVMSDTGENFRFHVIGDGPNLGVIRDEVNKQELNGAVLLHGFVKNTAPVLKDMDMLVIVSDHEGLPMTLLEAMTLNVPVLSRNLPSIKEVLCDGGCGYVLETEDMLEFAEKILELSVNDDDLKSKAKLASKQVVDSYNIRKNKNTYMHLYLSLLNGVGLAAG